MCCSDSSVLYPEDGNTKCSPKDCLVYAIYSRAGIGDQGYQDMTYYGITQAMKKFNFSLENVHPASSEAAEKYIQRFFDESNQGNYKQRLLVLANSEYNSLFKKHDNWKQNSKNKILILDSEKNDSIDAHFWSISLYGASYLAGRTVKDMGMNSIGIIAANPVAIPVQNAVNGFIDGFEKKGGKFNRDSIKYLGKAEDEGFDSFESYIIGVTSFFSDSLDFLFPVIGGSSNNLFRFMREKQDSISYFSCGMDVNQEYLNKRIPFSIEKRINLLAEEFLSRWSAGDSLSPYFLADLKTDFIGIKVSQNFSNWEPHFEKFLDEAREAESYYLENEK